MVQWFREKSEVAQLGLLLLVFSAVLVLMGVLQVVQYARLQSFQNCQAAFNASGYNVRDVRQQYQMRDQNATAEVLEAVKTKDPAKIDEAVNKAVAAHEAYVRIQKTHPYKPPESFCGRKVAPP